MCPAVHKLIDLAELPPNEPPGRSAEPRRPRRVQDLGDAEKLAQILLVENRVEVILLYADVDYDPVDA